jgi:hypothetical protein
MIKVLLLMDTVYYAVTIIELAKIQGDGSKLKY